MPAPIDMPPASWAPLLQASMIPGPPPVMTAYPARANSAPVASAAAYIGSSGFVRRAEHRHRQPDLREGVESGHELGRDPVDPPRIGVDERGVLAAEQPFVLGGTVAWLNRVRHRARTV